jgi:plastocyanin
MAVVSLAAIGALVAAGAAFAASQTIVGQATDTFSLPTYTTDQGEVDTLQVTGSSHNATASGNGPDGKALFSSNTISGGTTPVNGTQYLTAGSYPFICTVHPTTMKATLVVTGNGTPVARPNVTLRVASTKVAKVAKGKLLIEVTATTKSDNVSVEAKLGNTSLGKATGLNLAAGAKQTVVLRLNKAAKNKLRSRKKATISATAEVPFGAPASAKGKLK